MLLSFFMQSVAHSPIVVRAKYLSGGRQWTTALVGNIVNDSLKIIDN